MQKAKEYDWKDSNMALFGSDTEKKVKKESAESEPAWQGAGSEVGLKIWRIVKFQVTDWEEDQYGEFFNGDSYIILNTYKEPEGDELKYDVHFWIGKQSTQDEYGTAAYKTVELDTFLDDKPIQHREVQGHESKLFKSYFDALTTLEGGADTGFKRVLPEAYVTRLFHVKKGANKKITCTEVPAKVGNLSSEDVFIIDNGLRIYQYNGSKCSADEKFKAATEVDKIEGKRAGCKTDTVEERSSSQNHPALKLLAPGKSDDAGEDAPGERKIFRIKDGEDMEEVASGDDISKDKLGSDDVYIINTGDHVYCWIGKGASVDERRNGLPYACNYLSGTETPWLPISVVAEGSEPAGFDF